MIEHFCLRIELNQHFSLYLLKWFSYAHHTPPKRKISMVSSCCGIVFGQQTADRVKLACYIFSSTFATEPNVRYQFTYSFCSCFICLSDLHPFRLIGRRHKQIPSRMRIEPEPKQTILRDFVFFGIEFCFNPLLRFTWIALFPFIVPHSVVGDTFSCIIIIFEAKKSWCWWSI